MRQALAFLEGLSPVEVDPPRPSPPPPPPPPPPRRRQRNWWLPLALVAPLAVLIAVALVLRPGSRPPIAPTAEPLPAPTSGPVDTGAASSGPVDTGAAYRNYRNVPVAVKSETFARLRSGAWVLPFGLGLGLLSASAFYGLVLYPRRNPPDEEPARFDRDPRLPRHFSLGAVGGTPAPLLGDADLDELADTLGYFASSESGPTLNVPASVEGTLRRGGIPALTFFRRRRLRSVLILEDRRAEARRWNTLPAELAAGLSQRGVPVIHGSFAGAPDRYTTPDGAVHLLEDLEDQRNAFVLLIFSDGEQLQRSFNPFALEALTFWPQVAWFDLREPRFWDPGVTLLERYGLPLYPATPAGLLQALRRFLSEQRAEPASRTNGATGFDLAEPTGAGMELYVEQLLGDTLPWAQDCALLQPISPALPTSCGAASTRSCRPSASSASTAYPIRASTRPASGLPPRSRPSSAAPACSAVATPSANRCSTTFSPRSRPPSRPSRPAWPTSPGRQRLSGCASSATLMTNLCAWPSLPTSARRCAVPFAPAWMGSAFQTRPIGCRSW